MLPMLLLTINCSISNKKNHLKLDELLDLINHFDNKKAKLSPIQKYAVGIMKTEVDSNKIERFIQDYHIAKRIWIVCYHLSLTQTNANTTKKDKLHNESK